MGSSPEILDWGQVTDITPLNVIKSQKQVALVVEYSYAGENLKGLYRPEKFVLENLDTRIPYPSEIYRDVAYHQVDRLLGWNITVPITPWSIKDGDKGVLRQYWDKVHTWQDYHYSFEKMNEDDRDFWIKTAVLDYICGVVDRNSNDILFITGTNEKKVADSGLSFVEGLSFVTHHSRVRDELRGRPIPQSVLNDLSLVTAPNLAPVTSEHVSEDDLAWVAKRAELLGHVKMVV